MATVSFRVAAQDRRQNSENIFNRKQIKMFWVAGSVVLEYYLSQPCKYIEVGRRYVNDRLTGNCDIFLVS